MFKAVIFDLDGVIVDTTRAHYLSWRDSFAEFGIKLTEDQYKRNMSGRKAWENAKRVLGEKAYQKNLQKVIVKKTIIFFQFFNQRVKLVQGVVEFLSELKRNIIPIALATSARREVLDFIFQKLSLRDYFDAIVTGYDVIQEKPHPEIFLKAASKIGAKPSDCVVFEDSHSGVEAAKRAGMKVVLIMTSHTQNEIPHVDKAIKDFSQISIKDIKML